MFRFIHPVYKFVAINKGNVELAIANLGKAEADVVEIRTGYQKLAEEFEGNISEFSSGLVTQNRAAQVVSMMIGCFVTLVAIILTIIIARNISIPIKKVIQTITKLAQGDISQEPIQMSLLVVKS